MDGISGLIAGTPTLRARATLLCHASKAGRGGVAEVWGREHHSHLRVHRVTVMATKPDNTVWVP